MLEKPLQIWKMIENRLILGKTIGTDNEKGPKRPKKENGSL